MGWFLLFSVACVAMAIGLFIYLKNKKGGVSENNREVANQLVHHFRTQVSEGVDLGRMIISLQEGGADFEKIGSVMFLMFVPQDGRPATMVGQMSANPEYPQQ